jgi:phospholipid/cholesterol/gamma-HCH transport system substrate-binding protein
MFSTPEFKVGALVVIVSGLIGIMSLKVSEGPGLFSRQNRYWFDIGDAGGLVENSAVKSAGIKVGVIEKIELVGDKARVHLLVDGKLKMRTSGLVELRSDGILGDRHVELLPGAVGDPELDNGGQIETALERGSINAMMKEIGKITESLGQLAENINKATGAQGDTSTTLGRIVKNIENLTGDLAQISGENKKKIGEIVDQVHSITGQLDGFISDDSPEGFKAGWEKAVASLHRIDSTLKNVEEISGKINRGEGTIGRLVNDEETAEKLNEAIGSFNDFMGGAGSLETSIDFHSEFLADADLTKSYLNLKIQPGPDRYYEVGIVDDPRGVVEEKDFERSGSLNENYNERVTFKNKIKFNALFAKNFYDFTVRGGIIENAGGVGFDYHMFSRRMRLSFEAFDFDDAVLRAFLRFNIFKGVYLIGGGDHLADDNLRSSFVGAGIFITNDDLKFLASQMNFN